MKEEVLQFLWKIQKFLNQKLHTTESQELKIFSPGIQNFNSGPDFSHARIKINELEWIGNVEIHLKASDWIRHRHHENPAYENVILHVVWENDTPIKRADNTQIPTLELSQFVDKKWIASYQKFINQNIAINCKNFLADINPIIWYSNLDALLSLRLRQKAAIILEILQKTNHDWEETTYQVLGRNFGFSLNQGVFHEVTKSIPHATLKKVSQYESKLAIVLGVAGFLDSNEKNEDEYQEFLKKEYHFYKQKYHFKTFLEKSHWKMGRMRPPNFPTIRLVQFSTLIHYFPKLFFDLIELENSKTIIDSFQKMEIAPYWTEHYDFQKKLKKGNNKIGETTIQNIVINTIAPLLAAYAQYTNQDEMMNKAINWLENMPPEQNYITKKWTALGKKPKSAFDSQAMIMLYKQFCTQNKCLRCGVGSYLFMK